MKVVILVVVIIVVAGLSSVQSDSFNIIYLLYNATNMTEHATCV